MVNIAAVSLIVSTHAAYSIVSEIKFEFNVKFKHNAEIILPPSKQCVITAAHTNAAWKCKTAKIKGGIFIKHFPLSFNTPNVFFESNTKD